MSRLRLTLPLIALAAAAACAPRPEDVANGDDPLQALSSTAQSTRYQGPYWVEQRRLKSELWRQATTYCTPERTRELPNCRPVAAAAEAERAAERADSVLRGIGGGRSGARRTRQREF